MKFSAAQQKLINELSFPRSSKVREWKEKGIDITSQQYVFMLYEQENKCAICRKKFDDNNYACLDHCHKTLKVRGILCNRCNLAIGNMDDDPALLTKAAKYLKINRSPFDFRY